MLQCGQLAGHQEGLVASGCLSHPEQAHAVRTSCTIASGLTLRPVIAKPGQFFFSRSRCHTLPTLLLCSSHISQAARTASDSLSVSDSGRTVSIGTCIHETQRSLLGGNSPQRRHAPCNVMRNFTNKGFCCDWLRCCYPRPLGIPAWAQHGEVDSCIDHDAPCALQQRWAPGQRPTSSK